MRDKAMEAHLTGVYVAQCAAKAARFNNCGEVVDTSRPLSLVLPWPPTGNHATKHTLGGQHYLTAEYKAYRGVVERILASQARKPMEGRLHVVAQFWPGDRRARDLDNVWKVCGDSLQRAGAFITDAQIDHLELIRMPVKPNEATCSVTIRERT